LTNGVSFDIGNIKIRDRSKHKFMNMKNHENIKNELVRQGNTLYEMTRESRLPF